MKLRKISGFLICIMILSLLAGCGSKSSENPVEDMQARYSKFVTLGQYKGVEYTPSHTEVTDDDIQRDIDSLIYQNTTKNQIKEGIATMGDTVNIDFVGYIDGEPFEGGDSQGAGYDLTLGSGSFIDNFEEQIAGHSPGDAFDVNVTFPEDYGSEDLAGKEALFETTLNYIVENVAPEYNDALVATATDYSTTKEFEDAKRAEHEATNAESDLQADKNAIFTKVFDACQVSEYPENMIIEKVDGYLNSIEQEAEANGTDINTYLSNYGYDLESFKSIIKENVEQDVRYKMIYATIAKEEGITATKEEADAKAQEILGQTGLSDVETLNATYGYTNDDYYFFVIMEKIQDLIYENAVAVEGSPTDATEE